MSIKRQIVSWPEDGPASLQDIVEPLVELAHQLFELTVRDVEDPIGYIGYEIGGLHVSLGVLETMTVENLEWLRDSQGMERIEVLLMLAVQLGIEQGRRVEAQHAKEKRIVTFAEAAANRSVNPTLPDPPSSFGQTLADGTPVADFSIPRLGIIGTSLPVGVKPAADALPSPAIPLTVDPEMKTRGSFTPADALKEVIEIYLAPLTKPARDARKAERKRKRMQKHIRALAAIVQGAQSKGFGK